MNRFRLVVLAVSIVALAAGSAFATKQDELNALSLKPWSIVDLPQLSPQADVNEVEPNDACGAGNAYTLNDVFHGELTTGDDDWISFSANSGDAITVGTDEDVLTTDLVDTFIELWDDTCGAMLDSDDDGGPGLYSLIANFAAPYTGTYNVKIRGFGGTSTGFYVAIGNAVAPTGPGFCPLGLYKGVKRNVNLDIPDNDPGAPLVAPPITFFDVPGMVVTDVVVDLNIEHTWAGDLIVTLRHTSDGGVVTDVDLMNRNGGGTFGCSGDLVSDPENKYYFSGRPDLDLLGDVDCPSVINPACYRAVGDMTPFLGIPLGDGTWELIISDNAGGDVGFLYNWSVHILADAPVSVDASSWGAIKAEYR